MIDKVNSAIGSIREVSDFKPYLAAVLGSGLGFLADQISEAVEIPYHRIEGFPQPSVDGHSGRLVMGWLEGAPVAFLCGRVHLYEGYPPQEVVVPVRALRMLGAEILLVTNAAGGLAPDYRPGDLMLIEDHINFMGRNPLVGPNNAEWGERFPDMSEAYDRSLRELALAVADELGVKLHRGVYVGVQGPSYETPAEIRMFAQWGAHAVGMSTVPEVIAARHMGMRVLTISCIANLAAGIAPGLLTHDDITEAVLRARAPFARLVQGIIRRLATKNIK